MGSLVTDLFALAIPTGQEFDFASLGGTVKGTGSKASCLHTVVHTHLSCKVAASRAHTFVTGPWGVGLSFHNVFCLKKTLYEIWINLSTQRATPWYWSYNCCRLHLWMSDVFLWSVTLGGDANTVIRWLFAHSFSPHIISQADEHS